LASHPAPNAITVNTVIIPARADNIWSLPSLLTIHPCHSTYGFQ
jgi:hypothetical protein